MNKYFLDILSIRSEDLKKLDNSNVLPYSWSDFLKIETEVKQILNNIIKNSKSNKEKDLLLINYKIFIDLSNILYNILILNNPKSVSKYSSSSIYYNKLDLDSIPGKFINKPLELKPLNFIDKIKLKLRLFKRFLKNNSIISILNFSDVDYYIYESHSKFTLEHLKSKKSLKFPISIHEISSKYNHKKLSRKEALLCESISELILNKYHILFSNYGLSINNNLFDCLRNHFADIFKNTTKYLLIFDDYLKNKNPLNLFIGSNNNMLLRAFTTSVRNNFGIVSGFTHGEPVIYNWDKTSWMELSMVDSFFEYTPNLAKQLKIVVKNFKPLNNNKVSIKSFNTNCFQNFKRESNSNPSTFTSVMFVANEYCREGELSQVTSFPNSIQFEFETKLLLHLSHKYDIVYYKAHPGGVLKYSEIDFFPKNVEIITDPFETVLNLSNTIIFGHSRTTTIGSALSCNKKVILFLGSWEPINDSILESLNKQIFIIKYKEVNSLLTVDFRILDDILISNNKNSNLFYQNYLIT